MTFKWTLLRAGAFRLDGGSMFGVVPKSIWSKQVEADEHNRISLQTNCLLLEDGGTRTLIETGYGGKWSARERAYFDLEERTILDALAEIYVDPASIRIVVVTHLHFDHAGGLTHFDEHGEAVSSFPNAEIIVQRSEWEDAMANKSTMTRTYLRSHLDPIVSQIRPTTGEAAVRSNLLVFPMPGHTWGQQAVRFQDAEGVVCFPGDVLPTVRHAPPAYSMGYDMLPYENMLSKQKLLARAAAEGWRLVLDHEPGNPVVRVVDDTDRPGRYALVPA